MRPGRRYWFWSLGIAEALAVGLIVLSATGNGRDDEFDPWVVAFYLYYWALLCVAGAFIGWTAWAGRIGLCRAHRTSLRCSV